MPIVEYQCPKCQKVEEKIFKVNEKIPDYFYNSCCHAKSEKLISIPAKRRDMTIVGDNKL